MGNLSDAAKLLDELSDDEDKKPNAESNGSTEEAQKKDGTIKVADHQGRPVNLGRSRGSFVPYPPLEKKQKEE
jgi:hypothetical protein